MIRVIGDRGQIEPPEAGGEMSNTDEKARKLDFG